MMTPSIDLLFIIQGCKYILFQNIKTTENLIGQLVSKTIVAYFYMKEDTKY